MKTFIKPNNSVLIADKVTSVVGSWNFIIIQSIFIVFWIIINLLSPQKLWDPYPFILLNLFMSFQSAFTAPIIMMSQNRQTERDRKEAYNDHRINVLAEKEIEQVMDTLKIIDEKVTRHEQIKTEIQSMQQELKDLQKIISLNEKL
jgi:uncharacterized membrane protein